MQNHQLIFKAQSFVWLALIGRQPACEMPSEMQGCLQWVTALQMLSFCIFAISTLTNGDGCALLVIIMCCQTPTMPSLGTKSF